MKFLIIFCSLLITYSSQLSAGSYTIDDPICVNKNDTTPRLRDNFCKCAGGFLDYLSKDNNLTDDLKRIKKKKEQLQLLNSVQNLVTGYLNDYKKVTDPLVKPDFMNAQIHHFNRLISEAMLIKTIDSFYIGNLDALKGDDVKFDIDKFCRKKEAKPDDKFFCDFINEDYKKSFIQKWGADSSMQDLFQDFHALYSSAIDSSDPNSKKEIDSKIKNILDEIPNANNPSVIFNSANKFTLSSQEILNSAGLNVEECLKKERKSDVDCHKIYLDLKKETVEEISRALTTLPPLSNDADSKMVQARNKLSEHFSQKIKEAFSNFDESKNLTDALKTFSDISSKIDTDGQTIQDAYKNISNMGIDVVNFKSKIEQFQRDCTNKHFTLENKNALIESVANCSSLLEAVVSNLKNEGIDKLTKEVLDMEAALRKKMNADDFRRNHLFQNYVANKFMRECNGATTSVTTDVITGCGNDPISPITNFKIGRDIYQIIGKIGQGSDYEHTFTKDEMKEYIELCQKNSDPKLNMLCANMRDDQKVVRKTVSDREWEQVRRKNWVVYDSKAKNGYRIIPKKSNGSIFASAAVPALINQVPNWLMNYNAKSNIGFMEERALAQKQWMWDMEQANTFWYNNMFSGQSSSLTTYPGFNFSN